ncbi:MAG: hypothetical protein JO013_16240 [Alphaproteobacteria bacterium]|nr:hypothetical protein [Alphaproteobacteria bacterium]
MPSEKTQVLEYLGKRYLAGDFPDGIIRNDDVVDAIRVTGASLSKSNPANFLKDVIRKTSANQNWPTLLKEERVTARQRYGEKRVMQFIPYGEDQNVPFPDPFEPDEATRVHLVQTASLPYVARHLGRSEETWLTQIAVNLRLVETQLALFSEGDQREHLRDIYHLQTGIKTQPEIDASFIASYTSSDDEQILPDYTFITCEVKQRNERILPDQIREQIAKAFDITASLVDPAIAYVKALAMKVVPVPAAVGQREFGVYVVEFNSIARDEFDQEYRNSPDPEALYRMPLARCATTLFRLSPRIKAIG